LGTLRKQLRPRQAGPRRLAGAFLVAATLFTVGDGRAQAEDEDLTARREAAQDLADSAFDLLQKQRYGAAAELFEKADKTFHSPVFVVFQAEAVEKRGDWIAARRLLQKVVDEKLADYAPDAFRQAQDKAKGRIAALDEKIPTFTLQVAGADGSTSVTVNGAPFEGRIGDPWQVNPGSYEIVVTGSSGRSDSASLELGEGDRKVTELDVSVPSEPDPIDDPPIEEDEEGGGMAPWIPPVIAYGIGGVGLIMGAAAGGVFLGKQSDLKEACENDGDGDPNTCPPEQQGEGDSVKTVGNISTAGWVIAGIGVVAGTVLLFVPISDEGSVVSAGLDVGPGSLGLSGRF
jgi:hypothetical protein